MNIKLFRTLLVYLLLAALIYLAFRNAPLAEIWRTLKSLQAWQVITLMLINGAIYILITLRWWLIIRAEYYFKKIDYFSLVTARMAVFGVSYFTFGPQVGGEALQILYLQRAYGISYTRATSTVVMDKLLEFLANFVLLVVGLAAIIEAGILLPGKNNLPVGMAALVVVLALPPIHIALLYRGVHPISIILKKIMQGNKFTRFVSAVERMAGRFCRRHFVSLAAGIFVSICAAACMVTEFFMITSFLKIDLSFWQTIVAWLAGWLAFLTPLPGGLGALEASQVFTLGAFGISPASAISIAMLIRARDLLIGGLGLLFAGRVK